MTKTNPEAKPQGPYVVWQQGKDRVCVWIGGACVALFEIGNTATGYFSTSDARRHAEDFAARLNAEAAAKEPKT